MKTITYKPTAGTWIGEACREAVAIAKRYRAFVRFEFNDQKLFATPKKSPFTILWERTMEDNRITFSPKVVAERKAMELHQSARLSGNQSFVNYLMENLEKDLKSHDSAMEWLQKFVPLVDDIGINFDAKTMIEAITSNGYSHNQHVGQSPAWFNTRERMAQYIMGQVLDCLQRGMPPHPVTVKFCDEYFTIPEAP